jgi:four helix bundle protein
MGELPYRRLIGWQKAFALAKEVLDLVESPRFRRHPDLARQVSRAATSVPANVAEGNGRGTRLDFASFVDRARGSFFELDSWLLLCSERGLIDADDYARLHADVLETNAVLWKLRESQRQRSGGDRNRSL